MQDATGPNSSDYSTDAALGYPRTASGTGGGGITRREGGDSVFLTGLPHCLDSFQEPQVLGENEGRQGWMEEGWSTLPALDPWAWASIG